MWFHVVVGFAQPQSFRVGDPLLELGIGMAMCGSKQQYVLPGTVQLFVNNE
jgi:hypothetical protein